MAGGRLRQACRRGHRVASLSEVVRELFALALARRALRRERPGERRELLVARQERVVLVTEPDLVALAEEMRALHLDARGLGFGERDARA